MRLSYRGSNYETSPTKMLNQQCFITAKYRGISYDIVNLKTVQTQPQAELKYRGINYVCSSD